MAKTVTLQIKVTDDIRDKLRIQAAINRQTLAEFVRSMAQVGIEESGFEIDMSEGLDTWGGAGRKGKSEDA
jgi:hypothetical protein